MKKEIKKEEDDQTDQLDFPDKTGHSVTLQSNWNRKAKMKIIFIKIIFGRRIIWLPVTNNNTNS